MLPEIRELLKLEAQRMGISETRLIAFYEKNDGKDYERIKALSMYLESRLLTLDEVLTVSEQECRNLRDAYLAVVSNHLKIGDAKKMSEEERKCFSRRHDTFPNPDKAIETWMEKLRYFRLHGFHQEPALRSVRFFTDVVREYESVPARTVVASDTWWLNSPAVKQETGEIIVFYSPRNLIMILDPQGGNRSISAEEKNLSMMTVLPDGKLAAVEKGLQNDTIYIFDLQNGGIIRRYDQVGFISYLHTMGYSFVTHESGPQGLITLYADNQIRNFVTMYRPRVSIVISGFNLLVAGYDEQRGTHCKMYDFLQQPEMIDEFPLNIPSIEKMIWIGTNHIAISDASNRIYIYNYVSKDEVTNFDSFLGRITALAEIDGSLVIGGNNGRIHEFHPFSGSLLRAFSVRNVDGIHSEAALRSLYRECRRSEYANVAQEHVDEPGISPQIR